VTLPPGFGLLKEGSDAVAGGGHREAPPALIRDALRGVVPITALCAGYGISRKTGYKFLARYRAFGASGLADRSRRPHRSPTALDPVLLQRLLDAHERHPYWRPRKLLRVVSQAGQRHRGPCAPPSPAASSIWGW
jgi:hypothetical protein